LLTLEEYESEFQTRAFSELSLFKATIEKLDALSASNPEVAQFIVLVYRKLETPFLVLAKNQVSGF